MDVGRRVGGQVAPSNSIQTDKKQGEHGEVRGSNQGQVGTKGRRQKGTLLARQWLLVVAGMTHMKQSSYIHSTGRSQHPV